MAKHKRKGFAFSHKDLNYITIQEKKKDVHIIEHGKRKQSMDPTNYMSLNGQNKQSTSPVAQQFPVYNKRAHIIAARKAMAKLNDQNFNAQGLVKGMKDPNLSYMNNFKLCIKNFDILKDNKQIPKKVVYPMRYQTRKAMIEYRNTGKNFFKTTALDEKTPGLQRRGSQIPEDSNQLLINKDMIKKSKFGNIEESERKSRMLKTTRSFLIKPKLTFSLLFKKGQSTHQKPKGIEDVALKQRLYDEYYRSLTKKNLDKIMRSDTARIEEREDKISPDIDDTKKKHHHVFIYPPKNDDVRSMRALSPVEEQSRGVMNSDKVKTELKNTLDIATNMDDYTYHFATRNLRANKLRFKSTKQKFDEEEIKKFLNIIKMGKEMDLYKALMKNPNLVDVSDFMGRTPVHWAVIRDQAECLRILLHFKPSIDLKDLFNQTPLDIAFAGTNENIKLMLQNVVKKQTLVPEDIRKKYLSSDLSSYAEEVLFDSVKKISGL
ncbi:unnamed protein product [Moneuplotes crassus]|uniref:Uncharacterized protein n=1 Tax=Euplotes crassus TaxID=5936 RepID=A0AAD1U107_EUPCR|nr:unnamed protein product [Moneuplotes crassus]